MCTMYISTQKVKYLVSIYTFDNTIYVPISEARKNVNLLKFPERLTTRELRYLSGMAEGAYWQYAEDLAEKEVRTEELSEGSIVLIQRLKQRHNLSFKMVAFLMSLNEKQVQVIERGNVKTVFSIQILLNVAFVF